MNNKYSTLWDGLTLSELYTFMKYLVIRCTFRFDKIEIPNYDLEKKISTL